MASAKAFQVLSLSSLVPPQPPPLGRSLRRKPQSEPGAGEGLGIPLSLTRKQPFQGLIFLTSKAKHGPELMKILQVIYFSAT